MQGYILDTNIVSYWFDGSCLQNKAVVERVASLPQGTPLAISASRLFERFAPVEKRSKNRRPEQLTDPSTGRELGVQENDLWIAAQAIEHNLVLVTNDVLARIREAGADLRIENWTIAQGT